MQTIGRLMIVLVLGAGLVLPASATAAEPSSAVEQDTVVALGDSLAFGLWDLRGGYANRYAELLDADLVKIAWPGWTTEDLAAAVEQSWVQEAVKGADVVVFDIGGNDLAALRAAYTSGCAPIDVAPVIDAWNRIFDVLAGIVDDGAPILSFTLYNPYVDQDRGTDSCPDDGDDLDNLQNALQEFNDGIERDGVADVFTAFNLRRNRLVDPARKWYLAFDDFHPNWRGHQKIAELLEEATPDR